eukprot:TRINITY_DN122_c1_g1_i1.p1 TRINITY_DN122_c1_g1~~TRINITY_DN122_c1_g1_i1.p1  ORF type:complete len:100 (+),score=9.21 TRINITY_DN122_c1_g1_i1:383-682(+)
MIWALLYWMHQEELEYDALDLSTVFEGSLLYRPCETNVCSLGFHVMLANGQFASRTYFSDVVCACGLVCVQYRIVLILGGTHWERAYCKYGHTLIAGDL